MAAQASDEAASALNLLDRNPPHILSIAQELRDTIYGFLLLASKDVVVCRCSKVHGDRPPDNGADDAVANYLAISSTCHQLDCEASIYFFGNNRFGCWIDVPRYPTLPGLDHHLKLIRHITLYRYVFASGLQLEHGGSLPIGILELKFGTRNVHKTVYMLEAIGTLSNVLATMYQGKGKCVAVPEDLQERGKEVAVAAIEGFGRALKEDGCLTRSMVDDLAQTLTDVW